MKIACIILTLLIAPTLLGCSAMGAAGRAARFGGSAAGKAAKYGAAKSSTRAVRKMPVVVDDVERPSRRSLVDHVQPGVDLIGNLPSGVDVGSYDPQRKDQRKNSPFTIANPYVQTQAAPRANVYSPKPPKSVTNRNVDFLRRGYRPPVIGGR